MPLPALYISRDLEADWLSAIEFGRVDDGVPSDHWKPVADSAAWLLDAPRGRKVGARVNHASTCDLAGTDHDAFWAPSSPRFYAPQLGLTNVSMGEVLLATQVAYRDQPTVNRFYFREAMSTTGADALAFWGLCLESGDPMAHYGLGYTHHELGHHHDAYRHLRFYTGLAPDEPWAWCWLGKAALALGLRVEAMEAWRHALKLDSDGDVEEEILELLDEAERADG